MSLGTVIIVKIIEQISSGEKKNMCSNGDNKSLHPLTCFHILLDLADVYPDDNDEES